MGGKDYHSLSEGDYEDSDIDSVENSNSGFSPSEEDEQVEAVPSENKLLKQIIESEVPDLEHLLSEFNSTIATLKAKLKPVLEKVEGR
jgi:hypothetical protein